MYLQRVDTCVSEMSAFLPELKTITNRSEAMCTCYPGHGARYTRHCDNPNQNGRKLTALLYLNEGWATGHGGELRTCHPPPFDSCTKAVLAPQAGVLCVAAGVCVCMRALKLTAGCGVPPRFQYQSTCTCVVRLV
jgi:Rps23 Pro-64 3,4-dihydroxylase Tpa1-like proline 4-hydroxylase